MADEKKLQQWQKFPVDRDVIERVRIMLSLGENEEFPEALWIIMGIHKAMERMFGEVSWGFRDVCSMIISTQSILPTLRNATKYVPGELVTVTSLNKQGWYWHPAPLGRHLINCYGDIFLVKTDDLAAPEAAITNSELNKNAAVGEVVRQKTSEPLTKENDPTAAYFAAADKAAKGELASV